MKLPKCPMCRTEMKEAGNDETKNTRAGKMYLRTIFHCDKDDIWVSLEIPKEVK